MYIFSVLLVSSYVDLLISTSDIGVLSSYERFPYQIENALVLLLYYCYIVAEVQEFDHGRPQEFLYGGASPKKAALKTKKAPPPKKKNCASNC